MLHKPQGEYCRSILPTKLVATGRIEGLKKKFRLFISDQSSTNPVKISSADVEIISVTEITTNIFLNKTSAKHKSSSPVLRISRWAKN